MRKTLVLAIISILFLMPVACHKRPISISVAVLSSSDRVFDPKLDNASAYIAIKASAYLDGRKCMVGAYAVIKKGDAVIRLLDNNVAYDVVSEYAWDGKDNSGTIVDPGEYTIAVIGTMCAENKSDSRPISVVRIGAVTMQFTGANNYETVYHKRNGSAGTYWPVTGPQWKNSKLSVSDKSDLDFDNASARTPPACWTNLAMPPQDAGDPSGVEDDRYNLPVCLKKGSKPSIIVTLGSSATSDNTHTAVSCGYPITDVPIRISADDFGASAETDLAPGGYGTITASSVVPNSIGKGTLGVNLKFQYKYGGKWRTMSGYQPTAHTVYRIYDDPQMGFAGTQYRPWIAALDRATAFYPPELTEPSLSETLDCAVRGVLLSEDLHYDTSMGACFFSTPAYDFNYNLTGITFALTDYLDRGCSSIVNCSDCGVVLSTYLSMIGVNGSCFEIRHANYPYQGFVLNYMKAIGWTNWTRNPFGSGIGYFSYHCIVTADAAADRVNDACVYLDGDGNPLQLPCTELLPRYMDANNYLWNLSEDYANIVRTSIVKCYLQ
jgi:hypothetical protein